MLHQSKPQYLILLMALFFCVWGVAQGQTANYDESKVGAYTLPDPLTFTNGKPVRTARDWKRRRAELIELFATNVYGHSPRDRKSVV